jgi:hypothetical protein
MREKHTFEPIAELLMDPITRCRAGLGTAERAGADVEVPLQRDSFCNDARYITVSLIIATRDLCHLLVRCFQSISRLFSSNPGS